MVDGARKYPVDILGMHHAVSDNMTNWDDLAVQDWFSNVGKSRAYQNGAINPHHEHPGRPGQLTYSQAQYCLHQYTKDGNKYGWRLTELIKRPFDNVAWALGNWEANTRAISIETSGNFLDKKLPRAALMLIADTFRQHDKNIGGALAVVPHSQFSATQCPGQIRDQIPEIVDMINNPAKWNEILWPNPTKPVPEAKAIEGGRVTLVAKNDSVNLWDLTTNPNYKSVKTFKAGEQIDVTHYINFNNTTYYLTEYSVQQGKKNGVNVTDVFMLRGDSKEQPLPYETIILDEPSIPEGETVVKVVGEAGKVRINYLVTTDNGKEVKRVETGREVIRQPVDQVVLKGTGKDEEYPNWFVEFINKLIEAIKNIIGGKK